MIVWRLALAGLEPLSGEGARRVGGRWNTKGRPMIYASEHLSLAMLEILVHLTREEFPELVAHEIAIDDSQIETLGEGAARRIRRARWSRAVTRAIGDRWLDERRSLGLRVPSVIVPREANVIINPEHPAASVLEVVSSEPLRFDPRLVPYAQTLGELPFHRASRPRGDQGTVPIPRRSSSLQAGRPPSSRG